MPAFDEYVLLLRDWFFLGIALAVPMLGLAYLLRSRKVSLLGPTRLRAVPWGGPEVLGAFVLSYLATWVFLDILHQHDLLSWVYGPQAKAGTDNPRLGLWAVTAALPFQIGGIVLLLHLGSRTLPYQVGLTTFRFGPNVLLGYVAWLVLTPAILFLHALTQRVYAQTTFYKPEPHPLQKLMLDSPLPADWVLTALTAIVAAPLLEELLYRGVLQQWLAAPSFPANQPPEQHPAADDLVPSSSENITADLTGIQHPSTPPNFGTEKSPGVDAAPGFQTGRAERDEERNPFVTPSPRARRSDIILGVSLFVAVFTRQKGIAGAIEDREALLFLWELQPAFFVLLLLPVYLLIRRRQRDAAAGAIFASSLLFAIWHSPVWPSPIPLFPLGVGLGWLAYRTQSLVAPMAVHMLFNGVAVLAMAHPDARLPEAPNGRAATSTVSRPVEASASSFVPGSSEPRRR